MFFSGVGILSILRPSEGTYISFFFPFFLFLFFKKKEKPWPRCLKKEKRDEKRNGGGTKKV
jgi:hypothetical protein